MKERWLSINKKCDKYLHSYLALGLEALAFFLAWYFKSFTASAVLLSLGVVMTSLLVLDGRLLAPYLLYGLLSISVLPYFNSIPLSVYIMIASFFLGFIILILKKLLLHDPLNRGFGNLGISFSLLVLEMFISSLAFDLTHEHPYMVYGYYADLIGIAIILIYFFFYWTASKDYPQFLYRLFYFFNLLIIFELVSTFFTEGKEAFFDINLGWGSKNVIAIALELSLPFVGELFACNKKRIDALIILVIDYYFIFVSNSRGGLFTSLFLLPLLTYILVRHHSDNVFHDSFVMLSGFICCLLIIGRVNEEFKRAVVRAIEMGGNLSGRDGIWEYALMLYKQNPVFGSSMEGLFQLYQDNFATGSEIGIGFAHNTIFTIMASLGTFGLVFFAYHLFEVIVSFMKSGVRHKAVLLFFLLVGLVHGIIDNTYFSIIYMLPYLVIFSDPHLLSLMSLRKRKEESSVKTVE